MSIVFHIMLIILIAVFFCLFFNDTIREKTISLLGRNLWSGSVPEKPKWCKELVSCWNCKWVSDKWDTSVPGLNCAWPENVTYYNAGAYGCKSRFLMTADKINHDGRCPYHNMSWCWHKKDIQAIEDWVRRR